MYSEFHVNSIKQNIVIEEERFALMENSRKENNYKAIGPAAFLTDCVMTFMPLMSTCEARPHTSVK